MPWLGSGVVTFVHNPWAKNSCMPLPSCKGVADLIVTWRGLQHLLPLLSPLHLCLDSLELLSSLLVTVNPSFIMWLSDPFGNILMIYSFQKLILGKNCGPLEKLVYFLFFTGSKY